MDASCIRGDKRGGEPDRLQKGQEIQCLVQPSVPTSAGMVKTIAATSAKYKWLKSPWKKALYFTLLEVL